MQVSVDNQILVEVFGAIVNSMRESGEVEVVTPGVGPIETCERVVYYNDNCVCTKIADLTPGVYNYTIMRPHFMFGNKLEIQRIFQQRTKHQGNKYPVIIMEQPFVETPREIGTEATIRLLFASFVPKTDNAGLPVYKKSYQTRFKSVLYPLYNDFVKHLRNSGFVKAWEITSKVDRPLFGEQKLIASDYWDVIDAKFKVTISKSCQIQVCEHLIYG